MTDDLRPLEWAMSAVWVRRFDDNNLDEAAMVQAEAHARGYPPLGPIQRTCPPGLPAHYTPDYPHQIRLAELKRQEAWQALELWKMQMLHSLEISPPVLDLLSEFEERLSSWTIPEWLRFPQLPPRPFSQNLWGWTPSHAEEGQECFHFMIACPPPPGRYEGHYTYGQLKHGVAWSLIETVCGCGQRALGVLLPDDVRTMHRVTLIVHRQRWQWPLRQEP